MRGETRQIGSGASQPHPELKPVLAGFLDPVRELRPCGVIPLTHCTHGRVLSNGLKHGKLGKLPI